MMRQWLFRLTPLIVAALFGAPRTATAAELAPSHYPTGVAPALELGFQAMPARLSRDTDRSFTSTPFVPAPHLRLQADNALVAGAVSVDAGVRATAAVAGQPLARAPPALS
jgi:hypothetical protein